MVETELEEFENNNIIILLHKVNHKILAYREESLKEYNITFSQSLAIAFLYYNGSAVTNQKAIEKYMNLAGSSVNNLLTTMQKRGLIYKVVNAIDARHYDISLTAKGIEIAEKIEGCFDEIDEKVISLLSEDESEDFKKILKRLMEKLSAR